MSRSGDKINYTLRLNKNVERKIFCDIISTLSYFAPVYNYRYIGFGSFYFSDFLLFHEKFKIHKGISLEIDSSTYAKKKDLLRFHLDSLELCLKKSRNGIQCNGDDIEKKASELAENAVQVFIDQIRHANALPANLNYCNMDEYKVSNFWGTINECKNEFLEFARNFYIKFLNNKKTNSSGHSGNKINEDILSNDILDEHIYSENVKKVIYNRYLYNRPFNYIDLIFKDAKDALKLNLWSTEQNNIIWLDFESFIDEDQLSALETSIKKANRGDLIIFSTSLLLHAEDRVEKLKNLKIQNEDRVPFDIKTKSCDKKEIAKTIQQIIFSAMESALAVKNTIKQDGDPDYRYQKVIECTYNDGMFMYTAGVIIFDERDDATDCNFPCEALKDKKWA